MQPWGFYGRQRELADLRAILERGRWFFVQISGRRRIGKTSLIQQALQQTGRDKRLYIQIPDPGCSNADIEVAITNVSPQEGKQVGGYLKVLSERYAMIERRLPIFAKPKARSGRYYICDNFLRSWLAALQRPVSAVHFSPEDQLIAQADQLLADAEGAALEELAGRLYEETSRKGVSDFPLSERIKGYWDRAGIEIDLVAISESTRRIRFGACKRNPDKLLSSLPPLRSNVEAFMSHHPQYASWTVERCAIAPHIPPALREKLTAEGVIAQSLADLWCRLLPPARRAHT